ncbi:MAG: zinc-dependent alcohol dehydrogenase family protein [Ardenticatenaceae bacterium]|nr:zinc-dependent alcohol dehydrogenase family protein [Ardenticatenaceae bacterium]
MRAMQLQAPAPIEERPLKEVDLPRPEPGPNEVRIRVHMVGVCHTDLHTVEGDLSLPRLPVVPGHQVVGTVDAVGSGVTRFRPGDRVGVAWLGWTCGRCAACLRGEENLCERAEFTGLQRDGGYADSLVADAAFVYPLPAGFSDAQAAPLLCAGIIGYRALRLTGLRPGQRLGLYGFGASAHMTIQVARSWGCQVYVVTRSEEHQRHARELGAVWVGGAGAAPPDPLDGSIIFAPAGSIVPGALQALRPGGILALAGITMSDLPQMPYELIYGERVLRSVANSTRQDAEELLALAAAIPIRTDVEVLPLQAANEALARVKHSQVRGAAVLEVV